MSHVCKIKSYGRVSYFLQLNNPMFSLRGTASSGLASAYFSCVFRFCSGSQPVDDLLRRGRQTDSFLGWQKSVDLCWLTGLLSKFKSWHRNCAFLDNDTSTRAHSVLVICSILRLQRNHGRHLQQTCSIFVSVSLCYCSIFFLFFVSIFCYLLIVSLLFSS